MEVEEHGVKMESKTYKIKISGEKKHLKKINKTELLVLLFDGLGHEVSVQIEQIKDE